MMNKSPKELKALTKEISLIAQMAGRKLVRFQKKLNQLKVSHKEAQGVVSNADLESEKFIIKELKKLMPEALFLAEESAFSEYKGQKNAYEHFKNKEWLWVIDPLDGTTNYLNGMDYYAVCISLVFQGTPVLGVVHRPSFNHTYYASKGGGAYFQEGKGRARRVFESLNQKKLKNGLLVTGFATEKGKPFNQEFKLFRELMDKSRGVRRMGSAALDLCLVADGIFDGFWERGLAPWDVAASGIICQEAGVCVTDYEKKVFHPFQESIVASRRPFYSKLIKELG